MVVITGAPDVLTAVNEAMSLLPLAARPIDVRLFVHVYVVVPPVLVVPNVTSVVLAALQTTWLEGWFTCAVGLTVMVKAVVGPVQPAAVRGVIVIVPEIGAAVLLIAVKEGMFPAPLAAKPIAGLLFTQVKLVVATGFPLTGIRAVMVLLQ